jgi:hypothetical protein
MTAWRSCSSPETRPAGHALPWDVSPAPGPVARHRHSHTVGIVRLRAAGRRPRQVALHADWRAHRTDRRWRRPAGHRRPAHRRHQDAQGRDPRAAALRLRRPPLPAGRDRLAVEGHRRRQDRRRALRPRASRDRGRAVRHPARRPDQSADARHPLELPQGHRRQGAAQARRPARARVADQARAGGQARAHRLRQGRTQRLRAPAGGSGGSRGGREPG